MTYDIDCTTIAKNMYNDAFDMDMIGEDPEILEAWKKDLDEAIYQLKAMAENPYNNDYWRTLVETLNRIYSE